MRSRLVITAVVLAVGALLAGGAFVALRSSPSTPDEAPDRLSAAAPAAPHPALAPSKPRGGRQFCLDEAMKELDLIRPARTKAAEDFTAKLVDGNSFRLSAQRGRPIFINFWATWCPPCREEMPAMERLWQQHKGSGLVMVAVSLDADAKVVPPFLAQHKFTFPIVLDPNMDVANAYAVRALPASFLIDRQGNLAAMALGPRTWDNDAAHSLIEGLTRP